MSSKMYYMIAGETENSRWCPEFGDSDFDTVQQELEDSKESMLNCGYVHTTIIPVKSDSQADVNEAFRILNGESGEAV